MLSGYRKALRFAISSEAKAYGWTLTIWGSGAIITHQHGLPDIAEVFTFIGGSLTAIAAIILLTFGSAMETWTSSGAPRYALGAIHIVSVLGSIAGAALAGASLPGGVIAFGVVGFVASAAYQLLIGVEVALTTVGEQDDDDGSGDGDGSTS